MNEILISGRDDTRMEKGPILIASFTLESLQLISRQLLPSSKQHSNFSNSEDLIFQQMNEHSQQWMNGRYEKRIEKCIHFHLIIWKFSKPTYSGYRLLPVNTTLNKKVNKRNASANALNVI